MDKFQKRVEKFMQLAQQDIPEKPTLDIPDKDRLLRCSLILEEAFEFCRDSGVSVFSGDNALVFKELVLALNGDKPNLAKIVDAVGDIKYVADGAASCYGVDMQRIDASISRANIRKFGKGGYKDLFGKWNKPPKWRGPDKDIEKELRRQGYEG